MLRNESPPEQAWGFLDDRPKIHGPPNLAPQPFSPNLLQALLLECNPGVGDTTQCKIRLVGQSPNVDFGMRVIGGLLSVGRPHAVSIPHHCSSRISQLPEASLAIWRPFHGKAGKIFLAWGVGDPTQPCMEPKPPFEGEDLVSIVGLGAFFSWGCRVSSRWLFDCKFKRFKLADSLAS